MPLSICEFRENRLMKGHAFLTALNYIGTCTVPRYGIVERLCEYMTTSRSTIACYLRCGRRSVARCCF